jgi:hypothetical protein
MDSLAAMAGLFFYDAGTCLKSRFNLKYGQWFLQIWAIKQAIIDSLI